MPARPLNSLVALAFAVGGGLFALGAAIAQVGSGDAATSASIYLAGGAFFSTGGYGSVLQAVNFPPGAAAESGGGWRWWRYEPTRPGWLAAFVLFVGTLAFAISLVSAFIEGLDAQQTNRLIWAPEITGCVLFLLSGHFAFAALRLAGRRPRLDDLGWWVAGVNQLGSVLFFLAGLAAFTRPLTDSIVNVDLANWGTLSGAVCFALGGVLQAFER